MLALALPLLLSTAPAPAAGPEPQIPTKRHARVRVLLEHGSVEPGGSTWGALEFRIDEDWHLYWKNPGDSGLAPSVTWNLPEGVTAGPLHWPAPKRHVEGPVTTFVYEGTVLLPFEIHVAGEAEPFSPVRLGGDVRWLACKEICESERGGVSTLFMVAEPGSERTVPPTGVEVAAARAKIPAPRAGWSLELGNITDERVTLELDWSAAPPAEGLRPHDLFPGDALYDFAQPPTFVAREGGLTIELARSPGADAPTAFEGLLLLRAADSDESVAIPLATPTPTSTETVR